MTCGRVVFQNILGKYQLSILRKTLEAVDFITLLRGKNKVFLLSDYELENQELNGIDVIEKSNMQEQYILVTGVQTSEIKDFGEKK